MYCKKEQNMYKNVIKETCNSIINRFTNDGDHHLSIVLPLGNVNLHCLNGIVVVLSYRDGGVTPTSLDCFPKELENDFERTVLARMTEFWPDGANPIVKVTDMGSFARSLSSLASSFYEPALRQLYTEKVQQSGIDFTDEEALFECRYDFAGLYFKDGVFYITLADDEETVHKVSDILPDEFDCAVEMLEGGELCS